LNSKDRDLPNLFKKMNPYFINGTLEQRLNEVGFPIYSEFYMKNNFAGVIDFFQYCRESVLNYESDEKLEILYCDGNNIHNGFPTFLPERYGRSF
jgi:hypothetical protein